MQPCLFTSKLWIRVPLAILPWPLFLDEPEGLNFSKKIFSIFSEIFKFYFSKLNKKSKGLQPCLFTSKLWIRVPLAILPWPLFLDEPEGLNFSKKIFSIFSEIFKFYFSKLNKKEHGRLHTWIKTKDASISR